MSAQRTNAVLVFVAVLVAAAIVVYAIMSRKPATTPTEGQDTTPPAETQPIAADPIEPADDGVTLIDQTTDTTHAPAPIEIVEPEADAAAGDGLEESTGNTPATLIEAAGLGDVDVVGAMVLAGHDLNATDDGGRTALMAAAGGGHVDAVFVLLNAGADPARRDAARRAARDYALARYDEAGQTIARILGDAVGPPPVQDVGEK